MLVLCVARLLTIHTELPKPFYSGQFSSSCALFHFEYPLICLALHLARSSATVGPLAFRAFDGVVGFFTAPAVDPGLFALELLRRRFGGAGGKMQSSLGIMFFMHNSLCRAELRLMYLSVTGLYTIPGGFGKTQSSSAMCPSRHNLRC